MDLRKSTHMTLRTSIVIGAILLAVLVVIFNATRDIRAGVDKGKFQIVTLTTGERFFGKISGVNERYVTLSEVYFQQNEAATSDEKNESGNITVTKLSASIAKPENVLHVDRDKIAHWANLQDDSKIVQAIKQDGN